MKKIILFLFLISSLVYGKWELKIGTNIAGQHDMSNDSFFGNTVEGINTEGGANISLEYLFPIAFGFSAGFGTGFHSHGIPKSMIVAGQTIDVNVDNSLYNSIPIFASAKSVLGNEYGSFLRINFGYAINIANEISDNYSVDPGIYYSIGAGLQFNFIFLELAFENTEATAKHLNNGPDLTLDYSRLSFYLGFRF